MCEILLVEDNRGDIVLFEAALASLDWDCHVTVATDGLMALDLLFGTPQNKRRSLPDLIVLDLNLPCRSGADIIREMEADPQIRLVPLVVHTSSPNDQRVLANWDPKRCLYFVKSSSFDGLLDLVGKIHAFTEAV